MKLIIESDLIPLRNLDVLKIISSPKKSIGDGIILSKMITYDSDLEKMNLDLLDTNYGVFDSSGKNQ